LNAKLSENLKKISILNIREVVFVGRDVDDRPAVLQRGELAGRAAFIGTESRLGFAPSG